MKSLKNQKGFTGLEVVLIVVVVAILVGGGVYVHDHHKNAATSNSSTPTSTLETPKEPAFNEDKAQPVSKNGITISAPTDGSAVSGSFSLTGKVDGNAGETIQLEIDNDLYLLPANRSKGIAEGNQIVKINSDGTFNIPVDLNGNAVVASVDESNYNKMHGVSAGSHKFHVDIPNFDQSVDGPTVTLTVK
jgi:hypothetical protein